MNWHPHNGHACPVPLTTKVAVQFRNGWECTEAVEAGEYDWTWSGHTDLHIVGFAEVPQREDESMSEDEPDDTITHMAQDFLDRFDKGYRAAIAASRHANPPGPALDYEAQFRMAANSKAGAWGMEAVLRDMARRLRELEDAR